MGGKGLECPWNFCFSCATACWAAPSWTYPSTASPAKPFLLALASSANIGSSATPIGNPQNLVIAFNSKIPFPKFLLGILPAMLAGMAVNMVMLLCMYWKDLDGSSSPIDVDGKRMEAVEEGAGAHAGVERSPKLQLGSTNGGSGYMSPLMTENISTKHPWFMQCTEERRKLFLKSFAYIVTVGMVIAYMVGLNMSWTAITTAIALVVVDFRDSEPCLNTVSYSLLVFFSGMFITVSGFNKTGLPAAIWNFMAPYSKVNSVGGISVLSIIILLLSNLASNVPIGTYVFIRSCMRAILIGWHACSSAPVLINY